MKQKYFLKENDEYIVMSQTGVKQYRYPPNFSHNAIWDSRVGPDGYFYYALASEISTSNYVRLCRYDFKTHEAEELFRIEDVIMPTDRSIRASKFHTSISFLNDGRIMMTTHTTDKSPRHPTWMPQAYYHHMWEGFQGGHIVVYDPKTKQANTLGIPVPHETIYGAVYEPRHNALYFLGMMRGRLYRYDIDSRHVTCLGKVSENNAFRLVLAPDGHIYGSSRTGWLYKIDTDTNQLIDLNFQFPHETYLHNTRYNELSIARIGPDDRLYMAVMYGRNFYALDTKSGKIEDMGAYLPAEFYSVHENRNGVFGMDFDSDGVLWYAVTSLNNYEDNIEYGIPAGLFRWDVARGGKPEFAGILGTPDFGGAWISEVSIDKKTDILYAANSNHSLDGPGIIGIDLNKFIPTMEQRTEQLTDGYFDPKNPDYIRSGSLIHAQEKIMSDNPYTVPLNPLSPILLWRALAPDDIENSNVTGLYYEDSNTLCGVCGTDKQYFFTITEHKLSTIVPIEDADPEKVKKACERKKADLKLKNSLPHYPGRQYQAVVSASAELSDGRILVGTADGLMAIVKDGYAYSIGAAAPNGPIWQLAATPNRQTVYGVAGDEDDIATLISYDDQNGLKMLGFCENGHCKFVNDVFCATQIHSCAVSPDGKYLALGADERIGTVIIYEL